MHTLCLKKHPRHFQLYSRKHYLIFIIFRQSVTRDRAIKSCCIFPPYLNSVLHNLVKHKWWKCIFSIKHCMMLCKKRCNTHWNYHCVTFKLLNIYKTINCVNQTRSKSTQSGTQHSVSVVHRISIYQVSHGFSRQLGMSKMEEFLWQPCDESQWAILLGYLTFSKMLAAIKHSAAQILFLEKQYIIALCMQHNPTTAAKQSQFHCSWDTAPNNPVLNPIDYKIHTTAWPASVAQRARAVGAAVQWAWLTSSEGRGFVSHPCQHVKSGFCMLWD